MNQIEAHDREKICKVNVRNIIFTCICRILLLSLSSYYIVFFICSIGFKGYYALFILTLIIVMDTLWILFKRNGYDFEW